MVRTADPATTTIPRQIDCLTDASGYLYNPAGTTLDAEGNAIVRGVTILASDDPDIEPHDWSWYFKVYRDDLPSISGSESVGVVRFLMDIEQPAPEIIEAIQAAVAWFDEAKLEGIREVRKDAPGTPKGWDKVVVRDATAPPMWARFYEIGTNRPIFCGRDGVVKRRLADIDPERRTGYSWYGTYPAKLLSTHYPAWRARWVPGKNVSRR